MSYEQLSNRSCSVKVRPLMSLPIDHAPPRRGSKYSHTPLYVAYHEHTVQREGPPESITASNGPGDRAALTCPNAGTAPSADPYLPARGQILAKASTACHLHQAVCGGTSRPSRLPWPRRSLLDVKTCHGT